MESGPTSISNYGKAVNVGQVGMTEQHNNLAPGAEAVNIKDKSCRTQIFNNVGIHNQCIIPPPHPDNDAATWLACRSDVPIQWDQVRWSKIAGDYISIPRAYQLEDEVQCHWRQTEKSVKQLEEVVLIFQSKNNQRRESKNVSAEEAMRFVRDELKNAIDLYSVDFRKQSSVLGSLRDINANIATFLLWLKALYTDEHRSSLLSALRYIIRAIATEQGLDDSVVDIVANVMRAFEANLVDYMGTIRNCRLTAGLEIATIEMYQIIVKVFVVLLKGQGRGLKPSQHKNMDADIVSLKNILFSANTQARNRHKRYKKLDILPGDDPSLVPRLYHHFLLDCPPITRRRSIGNMATFNPDSRGAESANQSSRLKEKPATQCRLDPFESLSVETLIEYLQYDATAVVEHVKKGLQVNTMTKDMQKLESFMRQKTYQTWLKDQSKCFSLLVHGMSTPTSLVSALSYLCAQIAEEHANDNKIIIISYFCGLRVLDGDASAVDMLCQLIGQLLSQKAIARLYARDPVERNLRKKIKARDLKTLLGVFSSIIKRLRQCALEIFCLIDSITKIERVELRKDTEIVLKHLSELVREQKRRKGMIDDRMVFKLLVTDEARSLVAYRFFDTRETINLVVGSYLG